MRPFSQARIHEVLQQHTNKILGEIASLDADYILNASMTELESHFVEKAALEPFVLHHDDYCLESKSGVKIDVSGDFNRAITPGTRAFVQGTQLVIAVPFHGDPSLLQCRPSRYSLSGYPDISVLPDRITFNVTFPDDVADGDAIKREVEGNLQRLSEAASQLERDIRAFNATLPQAIVEALTKRKERAFKASNAVESLGIPIKRASNPPSFSVPVKRRKLPVSLPRVPKESYKPEPALQMAEYDHILKILHDMALVIERSPAAFATLDEESIRTHFLLQLNGHYEGGASGETFNASGKTDILIRVGDRNVFIAECKFWKGQKAFSAALDQLLGYLSWRDSKCALLVFNRTRSSSAVLQKMAEVMDERPEVKRRVTTSRADEARYILVKPDDTGREILLTTMLFDLPGD